LLTQLCRKSAGNSRTCLWN